MGCYNGWERANWFAHSSDDTSMVSAQTWERNGPWESRVREECEAVRDNVGVLDLPGFSRFELKGNDSEAFIDRLIVGKLPKIGKISLSYFSDKKGRILTEMSIMKNSETHFTLITAAAAQWHDYELLMNSIEPNSDISIEDTSSEISTLIVTGPKSRDLLTSITDADLTLPWLTHQKAMLDSMPVILARVSFAGELGWEVHVKNKYLKPIYEKIIHLGAQPFGMFALNSLRIEKGYRAWKGDLSSDYSILEAGLERFVKFDKDIDFIGKPALLREKQAGGKKSFVTLKVKSNGFDAPYMSTLWFNNKIVGETTSGAWGYRVNQSVALGMLKIDLCKPGTDIEVEIYGERFPATVQDNKPLWDPENTRLRQ